MRTLHRYILREMLAAILVAVVVCTGLLLLGNLLKEVLSLLMSGQATLGLVVRGIGLLLPFVLVFALPMGALTAALLVYGRLSADQELTAIRANGISLWSISVPVVTLGLALCGVCAWVNLDLAPRCRVAYKQLLEGLAEDRARTLIPPGRFVTQFPGFVIFAERIQGDEVENVLFFQMKDGRKVVDVRASRAHLELRKAEGKLRMTFEDGRMLKWVPRLPTPVTPAKPAATNLGTHTNTNTSASTNSDTNATPASADGSAAASGPDTQAVASGGSGSGTGTTSVSASAGDTEESDAGFWQAFIMEGSPVDLTLPPTGVFHGLPRLSDMTFRQLLVERAELRRLGIEETTPIEVQLHRQVAFSFATFGFVLIGIPLGVRSHRRETSVGVATAIGLVLVYYAFLIVAQALETKTEAAPWLIVWLPNIFFQLTGAWLLWRANRGR